MQKIYRAEMRDDDISLEDIKELRNLLEDDWKIVQATPILCCYINCGSYTRRIVYVLEKEDNDSGDNDGR